MKHDRNHDNARSEDRQLVPVHFEFTHLTAHTVAVAGTFNNWHPTSKSLRSAGSGLWLKEAFLPPGDYEYCLVVDGQWRPDPLARESVPNPYGGRNSILKVASTPEGAHRADAMSLPMNKAIKPKAQKL
jgi:1,4-alpha-glucan branching enzyme